MRPSTEPRTPAPLVSVAMPARDAQETVGRAIRSILAQTYDNLELIVLDDGSEDKTAGIVSQAAALDDRVRLVTSGFSAGAGPRLNQIADLARGEILARMDADDVAYPRRLQMQVEFLRAHPDVDLVGTSMLVFGADDKPLGKRLAPSHHQDICVKPRGGFPLFHPTWMGATSWFRAHRYSSTAVRCEDQELLFRTHRVSRFANLESILLGYQEKRLRLRPMLAGRANFAKSVGAAFARDGEWGHAMLAVSGQLAKGAADAFAIGSKLDHRVLRHRATPSSRSEDDEWMAVCRSLGHTPEDVIQAA